MILKNCYYYTSNKEGNNINSRVDLPEWFIWPAFPLPFLKVTSETLHRALVCVWAQFLKLECSATSQGQTPSFVSVDNGALFVQDPDMWHLEMKQWRGAAAACSAILSETPSPTLGQRSVTPFRDRNESLSFQ